jgi:hypothetical protein
MIRITLTHHAEADRLDRLTAILQNLELGEIVQEREFTYDNGPAVRCLTSTGIVLVKSLRTGKLVTGYMATMEQALKIYGRTRMPNTLYQTIKYNNKRYAFLLKM